MTDNIACNGITLLLTMSHVNATVEGRARFDDYMNGSKMADNAPIYESDSNSEDSIAS